MGGYSSPADVEVAPPLVLVPFVTRGRIDRGSRGGVSVHASPAPQPHKTIITRNQPPTTTIANCHHNRN